MNSNLRHVDLLIRRALHQHMVGLAEVTPEDSDRIAAQVSVELDRVGLITDPKRSFGLVLRRVPGGGWSSTPAPELTTPLNLPPEAEQRVKELELAAAEWDKTCACAAGVAQRLAAGTQQRPEVVSVQAHFDLVIVSIHVGDLPTYEAWLPYLSIAPESVRSIGYAALGNGQLEGAKVRLVAHGVPQLQEEAAARASEAGDSPQRCAAAHSEDPSACEGPLDAVLVRDQALPPRRDDDDTRGVLGCVHHAARMLASLEGGRVYPGAGGPGTAAVEVYTRAQALPPYAWRTAPQAEGGEGQ